MIAPRHECGVCGADALRYLFTDKPEHGGGHWWSCETCGEGHTSTQCCENPEVVAGDWIVLTKMDNDPDPVPLGTFGYVYNVNNFMDGTGQVHVNWLKETGGLRRGLMLVLPEDRFEKVYLMEELSA